MNNIFVDVVILIMAVIVHEIGHIISFYFTSKRFPLVSLKRWGIEVGGGEYLKKRTLNEVTLSAYIGILVGLIYLIILGVDNNFYLIYFLMCFIDFSIILQYYQAEEKFRNVELGRINLKID